MISDQYRIFGKSIRFHFNDPEDAFYRNLSMQLELYQKESTDIPASLIVHINIPKFEERFEILGVNPKTHSEIKDGFIADFGQYKTAMYMKDGVLHADLNIPCNKGAAHSYVNKFLSNIEFSSRHEMVGQICFESILVPSMYFDNDKCLIHSAGFSDANRMGILVGGTGGVGKTSMELSLCTEGEYKFLCDDIAVVSNDGNIHPNLAFPKIYGYNMEDNDVLKAKVFKQRSLIDKAAFKFRYYLKGPDKVRRKMSPKELFAGYENAPVPLGKYFILVKERRPSIECLAVDKKVAARMTVEIMSAEYWRFHNHLRWHIFNCAARDCDPIIVLDDVIKRWSACLNTALRRSKNYIVKIPLSSPHETLIQELSSVIRRTK
jgi:hypothetical protein